MVEAQSDLVWQAEEYHKLSHAQTYASDQLLRHLDFKGNECILDVGCGDGKISAKLATMVPVGSVLGVDISPEMICFAKHKFPKALYPNLTFLIENAEYFDYNNRFNLVFSSFALQWVKDKNKFLQNAYKSLVWQGIIAATIPLQISSELEQSIDLISSLSEWSLYLQDFVSNWHKRIKFILDTFADLKQMQLEATVLNYGQVITDADLTGENDHLTKQKLGASFQSVNALETFLMATNNAHYKAFYDVTR